jgi:hypothetical protein
MKLKIQPFGITVHVVAHYGAWRVFLAEYPNHADRTWFEDGQGGDVQPISKFELLLRLNGVDISSSVIVHEAVHAFQQACQAVGETSPSEEFEAYSIETIYTELFDHLKTEGRKESP